MAKKAISKKAAPAASKAWEYETSENNKGDLYIKGITPAGVAMWPFVWRASLTYAGRLLQNQGKQVGQEHYEYKCEILMSKKDPIVKDMIKTIETLAADHLGVNKDKLNFPFKDGDEKDDPQYAGKYYMILKAKQEGGPVPVLDSDFDPIVDQSEIYAGCFIMADVAFKTYKTGGNSGVSLYWQSLVKIGDGERVGFDKTEGAAKKWKGKKVSIPTIKDGEIVL